MKLLRTLILGAVALAVAGLVAGFFFQRQIGEAMFNRGVSAIAGVDRTAALPDGLHIFVCGSGSPMPDTNRAGPCLGVIAGERAFVVDVGSGGARRLARMGFPVGRLERVYLTHLHSDHFDGLGELLLQAWVGGSRTTPLPVAGPVGVEELVAGLNTAYRVDAGFRTAHHGEEIADPAGFGGRAEPIAAPEPTAPAQIFLNEGDLKITVIRVDHAPVAPSFGFRIDYKDRSVVISGDTKESAALVGASKDADILFHEALNIEMVQALEAANQARGLKHIAQIMTDIQDYHATPEQAARTASAANAGHLVLYHIVPPLPSPYFNAAYLGDAPKRFNGRLTVAQDGLLISAPANAKTVQYKMIR
jgi:ribonuclease Z